MNRSILTVIPARGGSLGIKKKNLRHLLGNPLIFYPIQTAKKVLGIGRIIVSTDDEEIAKYALTQGAEVPFIRPAELSGSSVTLVHVMKHALEYFKQNGIEYDAVLSIQATTPALKPDTIQRVVETFHGTNAESVVTIAEVVHGHPLICKRLTGNGKDEICDYFNISEGIQRYPRQVREPAYYPNGAIFLRDKKLLEHLDAETNCLGSHPKAVVMDRAESINIDTPLDFMIAEHILKQLMKKRGTIWGDEN